jgi:hypothetical protein
LCFTFDWERGWQKARERLDVEAGEKKVERGTRVGEIKVKRADCRGTKRTTEEGGGEEKEVRVMIELER